MGGYKYLGHSTSWHAYMDLKTINTLFYTDAIQVEGDSSSNRHTQYGEWIEESCLADTGTKRNDNGCYENKHDNQKRPYWRTQGCVVK